MNSDLETCLRIHDHRSRRREAEISRGFGSIFGLGVRLLMSVSTFLVLLVTVLLGASGAAAQAQPANDAFANRIVITGTNILVTGSSFGATKESGEPSHTGNSGGASVWWSWTAPSEGTVAISTAGSSFDTLLGVYTGTSVSALTQIASNDDADAGAGIYTSKVTFEVVPGETYQIAVDGYSGAWGAIQVSVLLAPTAPPSPAPAWTCPDPNGQMVHSTDFAGKVIILDFWGTWCGPCKAELPDLVALQEMYRADGLVVVGADGGWDGDTPQVVQSFLATWTPTINYPVVMANYAMIQAYGGMAYVPTTFIIDRQNLIRINYVGTQSRSTFERQIIPLLYRNGRLDCQRSGTQMTLCWPARAQAFTLESATNFASPAWSTWPTGPTVVNGTNTVTVPTTSSPRYFRLRMSY